MDLGVLLESPQGSQSSSRVGACTCAFHPSCSSSITLPVAWIKGSVSFLLGFPTKLSHEAFPQCCPTCHRAVSPSSARKSRQCRENSFPWNGLRHLGDCGNGGTTLEFLSPFLRRAPPLEMGREGREFFPNHAAKASHLSSYEAETGLIWMWAGLLRFLSSGDGYVGELLELQQGCEGPFGSSRGSF